MQQLSFDLHQPNSYNEIKNHVGKIIQAHCVLRPNIRKRPSIPTTLCSTYCILLECYPKDNHHITEHYITWLMRYPPTTDSFFKALLFINGVVVTITLGFEDIKLVHPQRITSV